MRRRLSIPLLIGALAVTEHGGCSNTPGTVDTIFHSSDPCLNGEMVLDEMRGIKQMLERGDITVVDQRTLEQRHFNGNTPQAEPEEGRQEFLTVEFSQASDATNFALIEEGNLARSAKKPNHVILTYREEWKTNTEDGECYTHKFTLSITEGSKRVNLGIDGTECSDGVTRKFVLKDAKSHLRTSTFPHKDLSSSPREWNMHSDSCSPEVAREIAEIFQHILQATRNLETHANSETSPLESEAECLEQLSPEERTVARETALKTIGISSHESSGSGFMIEPGIVTTADHVIRDDNGKLYSNVEVSWFVEDGVNEQGEKQYKMQTVIGKPLGGHDFYDIGFVALPEGVDGPDIIEQQKDIPWINPRKRSVNSPDLINKGLKGTPVIYVGTPEGAWHVSRGRVKDNGGRIDYNEFHWGNRTLSSPAVDTESQISKECRVRHGFSGGPAVDANGMLVGVTTNIDPDNPGLATFATARFIRKIKAQVEEELAEDELSITKVRANSENWFR